MPSPPPPSCCLCPEVEYNAGTTTLKTENVIGYVTDIVLSPLLVSEDNPHCRLCEQWGEWNNGKNYFPVTFTSFYKIAVCGSYSFDDNDNTINNVSNLNYFNAQKRHSCITHYIAIGK